MAGINSAGSLVGAVLESAGYIYQSSILDELSKPLVSEVGALVYLVGIVAVIIQLAVFRSSKLAAWLLIGPPIFFAILEIRQPIENARWSFGSEARDQSKVTQGINAVSEGAPQARVSFVFKKFVEMVSESTRAMVDTISNSQNENDLWMVIKGQAYGLMTTPQEDDPGLIQLIQYGLMDKCHQVIERARAVDDVTKRTNTPGAIQGVEDEMLRYFAPTRQQANEDYLKLLREQRVHSFRNADMVLEYIAAKLEGVPAAQVEDRKGVLAGYSFTCQDIWELSLQGIKRSARDVKNEIDKEVQRLGANVAAVDQVLLEASGEGDRSRSPLLSDKEASASNAEDMVLIISRYYLRNAIKRNDFGSRLAHFAGRTDIRRIKGRLHGSNSSTEASRIGAEEWSEKERLMYAAYSIPTYQGLGLYFLGVTFPFFALLLLVPGKAQGFLMWFMMWIWLKSWDIGLAIVMQIDTIFWALYANQKQRFVGSEKLPEDAAAAFSALGAMDPTFQMTGYYAMLAVCMLAIPVISAQFVMGGMKGGSSIIAQGVTKYSDFFSDAMLARTEQGVITQLRSDAFQLKEMRGLGYFLGGGLGKKALETSGMSSNGVFTASGGSGSSAAGSASASGSIYGKPAVQGVSQDYLSSSRLRSAVGYGYKAGLPTNFQGRIDAAVNLSRQVAVASGFAEPHKPFETKGDGVMQKIYNAHTLKERKFDQMAVTQRLAVASTDLSATVAHAGFEADIEAQAYSIHERMATFRAIPVPWTNFADEGSAKEVERHVARFTQKIEMLRARVQVAAGGVDAVLGATDKAKNSLVGAGLGAIAFSRLDMRVIDMIKHTHNIKGDTPEELERNLGVFLENNVDDVHEFLDAADSLSAFKGVSSSETGLRYRDTRMVDFSEVFADKESKTMRYGDKASKNRRD